MRLGRLSGRRPCSSHRTISKSTSGSPVNVAIITRPIRLVRFPSLPGSSSVISNRQGGSSRRLPLAARSSVYNRYGLGSFLQRLKSKSIFYETCKFTNCAALRDCRDPYLSAVCGWHFHCAKRWTCDVHRMIRIEKSENGDLVTFVLSGRMQKEDLQALKTLLKKHKKQTVVLDLKGVKLVDREAIRFLANFETENAKITNCPPYIREWIRREQAQE